MKVTFIGGGAHRLLGILRGALADPRLLTDGTIHLHDLDVARAETLGRMVMASPEFRRAPCAVRWGTTLEEALEGADAVGVILMAGSARTFALGNRVSLQRGYLSSDNVSPNGGMLAVKGGRTLLDIARRMERLCPDAWLLDFANPVAVFSAMLNHHTRIRALGVCAGFTNHFWDLARLLGRDEQDASFQVEAAGINHLSFIQRGSLQERDLFAALAEHLTPDWKPLRLGRQWSPVTRRNIRNGLRRMVQFLRELGVLIFSTEGDGMWHLYYEEALAEALLHPLPTRAQVERGCRAAARARAEGDRAFRAWLDRDLDDAFRRPQAEKDWVFQRQDEDIFVRILRGVAGTQPVHIVASRPNDGALAGIKSETVVEYSMTLQGRTLRPAGSYVLPDSVHGLIGALATHQTLLGDAIAQEDPRLLAQAFLAYPVRPYSRDLRKLTRELLAINADEIPPALANACEFL